MKFELTYTDWLALQKYFLFNKLSNKKNVFFDKLRYFSYCLVFGIGCSYLWDSIVLKIFSLIVFAILALIYITNYKSIKIKKLLSYLRKDYKEKLLNEQNIIGNKEIEMTETQLIYQSKNTMEIYNYSGLKKVEEFNNGVIITTSILSAIFIPNVAFCDEIQKNSFIENIQDKIKKNI